MATKKNRLSGGINQNVVNGVSGHVINPIQLKNPVGNGVQNGSVSKVPVNEPYPDIDLSYQNNVGNMTNAVNSVTPVGGGVTDEGVIVGSPNVENMPGIKEGSTQTESPKPTAGQAGNAGTSPDLKGWGTTGSTGGTGTGTGTGTGGSNDDGGADTGGGTTPPVEVTPPVEEGADSGNYLTWDEALKLWEELNGTKEEGPDSYEEFLMKQEGYYKQQYDAILASIEQNKANTAALIEQQLRQAEHAAEVDRERGVVDARSSYAQNLATYGANAEMLADMGLTSSGYSDYLSQQTYATQRAETQNANARSETAKQNARYAADSATLEAEQQAAADRLNADLSYAQNMQGNAEKLAQYQIQKQEQAKAEAQQRVQYFASLLEAANSGGLTADQLTALGAGMGLGEGAVGVLGNAANDYAAEQDALKAEQDQAQAEADADQIKQNFLALLDAAKSGAYTSEELAQLGTQYGLDENMIGYLQNAAADTMSGAMSDVYRNESTNIINQGSMYDTKYLDMLLSSGDLDQSTYDSLMKLYADVAASEDNTEVVDDLHDQGHIDEPTYQGYVDDWNKDIDASTFFEGTDYTAAKQAYDEFASNPWASEEKKEELKSTMIRNFATDVAKENLAEGLSGNKVKDFTIDIYDSNFKSSQFGDFLDGKDQRDLIEAYINDAKAGKIPEGKVCEFNYGETWDDHGYFVYAGDGIFVKYDDAGTLKSGTIYYPDGYKKGLGFRIVKE